MIVGPNVGPHAHATLRLLFQYKMACKLLHRIFLQLQC